MNIIKWDRKFETGIDIIDFQHKLILSRGNDLIKEINNNGSKASIGVYPGFPTKPVIRNF